MKKTLLSTLAAVFAATSLSMIAVPAEAKQKHKAHHAKKVKAAKKAGAPTAQ